MITFTIMCICTVTPHVDAGVVLGGAVRGGTKALQKMTAQERLQDLHAATQDLEVTATGITPHLQYSQVTEDSVRYGHVPCLSSFCFCCCGWCFC